MNASNKPTAYLLLSAYTGSDWDCCEFAIVHISEKWKETQRKRLEAIQLYADDYCLCSFNYYDTAVDFYYANDERSPNIDKILDGQRWAFVEFDEGEPETFCVPESRLDCHRLVLHRDGTAKYSAYGKHTDEEFWTDDIDLNAICNTIFIHEENQSL